MSEQPSQGPDVMQLWRDWLTQTERQFNSFTNDTMGSEATARTMAGFMELYVSSQRLMAEFMQRYLTFMNMPSRAELVSLGETLRDIQERLARIEQTLQIAADHVDGQPAEAPVEEPSRNRQPPAYSAPEEGVAAGAIPEELRR
ncbi:MAG: hypothetical protein WEB04_07450 [Dehalococcoidia bacterium]